MARFRPTLSPKTRRPPAIRKNVGKGKANKHQGGARYPLCGGGLAAISRSLAAISRMHRSQKLCPTRLDSAGAATPNQRAKRNLEAALLAVTGHAALRSKILAARESEGRLRDLAERESLVAVCSRIRGNVPAMSPLELLPSASG
jgi:hypothetical protein